MYFIVSFIKKNMVGNEILFICQYISTYIVNNMVILVSLIRLIGRANIFNVISDIPTS